MTREKVRMAVTSYEAETNEAIRYGGGFVDMVFEQPPAWIQSLPIVEYSDAELEEDAPAVEVPPPPDLEARHVLARMGGFGGDVNRAVHSIEGNIPSREGDNNRRDRHGGESDREEEEPWTQGEPIEPDELSPRTRPPIAPSRIDPETRFVRHPHPTQRWSNPVLAVTAP
uniref:Uncharacterized protein n=1 Tax=Chromera velia CCMP2878 TaxID=1169474 RepID=A0A0G4FYS1_9ALVE|eukprot:Cvel_19416.t1-p1 / transcript=Cvel_19416.t1 / gene=Cvel_19416 / organism=Chromera_velia_CCMP2878 / gene_product=hypothetical protein / transcript_product=hypothetical protein / location=Cvel_scaffold1672:15199-16367(+) / protein_length=169 / sequence_SO=supercontig / SO=protein_coding / is_pseudo=false